MAKLAPEGPQFPGGIVTGYCPKVVGKLAGFGMLAIMPGGNPKGIADRLKPRGVLVIV